jgi:hypothetical protein
VSVNLLVNGDDSFPVVILWYQLSWAFPIEVATEEIDILFRVNAEESRSSLR